MLRLETAGLGSRILAFLIDGAVQFVAGLTVFIGLAVLQPGADVFVVVAVVLLALPLTLLYHPLFETFNRGRSPGKMALGLRVVTREGGAIRFRHAIIRGLLALVDFHLTYGLAALVSVLATQHNQRLGDLVAGTLVVRERSGAGPVGPALSFAPPVGFEAFTASLDVSRMRSSDYEAVRAYCGRRTDLRPEVRADVARSLREPLAARLGHAPPAGIDADVYLRCVAAAFQARADRSAPTGPSSSPSPPEPAARPAPERPVAVDRDFLPPG